jgi:hypothetical protein
MDISAEYSAWNPGLQSQLPREYLPLSTIFCAENVETPVAKAYELSDFCGLPADELVAFRVTLTMQTSPLLQLFGRATTRQWEKLLCRISASDRDGRSDPTVRCALCYSTIAERRSGSTTECDRALS